MTQFRPFRGLVYNEPGSSPTDGVLDVSSVLGESSASEFAFKALVSDPGLIERWLKSENLYLDPQPSLYMYRAGWRHSDGTPEQATGVFGLVARPDFSAAANWLEPTPVRISNTDFELLLSPSEMPLVTATDADGTHWRVWPIHQAGIIQTIADALESAITSTEAAGLVVASTHDISPPPGLVFAVSEDKLASDNQ